MTGRVDSPEPGLDDPLSSIRPALPGPPVLAATIELSQAPGTGGGPRTGAGPTDEAPTPEPEPASELESATVLARELAEPSPDAPYELLAKLGVGGMGEVWQARQRVLGRIVAYKRLREGRSSPTIVRQFESEARLTGVLDHPNIVTVHELGHDRAGRVFYTMKLIRGTPWAEVLASNQRQTGDGETVSLDLRDHVEILLEVSHAIAFAHSRGVIHRDIKPGNVMIGDYGEVQVVDWGLAVALHPLTNLDGAETWTLADLPSNALVCGTPAYMSPETAAAQRERIGPATDVYLLGAVLFHIVYGRPPHQGRTVDEVIAKAKVNAWSFPTSVPRARQAWDALLRPVIARALATEPSLRFTDAGGFAEALRAALRNYASVKLAIQAQQRLAALAEQPDDGDGYKRIAAIIAQLEGALESWPDNLVARAALARAQLALASLALANNDLELAKISVDAFERVPKLPAPGELADPLAPQRRRVTLHPPDGTLIGAPRPSASLIEARTAEPDGAPGSLAEGPAPSGAASALAATDDVTRTADAAELAAQRQRARLLADRSAADLPIPLPSRSQPSGVWDDGAAFHHDQQALVEQATRLREGIREHQRETDRRRRLVRAALGLALGLGALVLVLMIVAGVALQRARDRARDERNQLSRVLLDEAANTTEAELEILFRPVAGALRTTVAWAEAGELDVDDPRLLNARFMPVLDSLGPVTSMLRADTRGHEYMLLRRPEGWRTRTTTPGMAQQLHEWSLAGALQRSWIDERPYGPHDRPWYRGGAALRREADDARARGLPAPIHWTAPYKFFTTGELGISASAPATSGSGRELVVAFDLTLADISTFTRALPVGIDRGQVFVLDEQLRVLGLPRESQALSPSEREALLFEPLPELDRLPVSQAACLAWRRRDHSTEPFRLEYGPDEAYWVGFRLLDRPDRPRVWIGVIVPESHFL